MWGEDLLCSLIGFKFSDRAFRNNVKSYSSLYFHYLPKCLINIQQRCNVLKMADKALMIFLTLFFILSFLYFNHMGSFFISNTADLPLPQNLCICCFLPLELSLFQYLLTPLLPIDTAQMTQLSQGLL